MKQFLASVAAVIFSLTLLAATGYTADKVVKLEFSCFLPAQDPLSLMMEDYCKEVGKRTNGRVLIAYYPGGTLTPMAQTYDGVVREISDMGFTSLSITVGRFPLMEVLDLPFGLKSGYWATKMATAFYNKFKPKELDDVKVMFLLTHGPGTVHTKTPVRKLEDMKGLKLRCPGGNIVNMVKALGAVPLVMPTPDTYDALRKGVADGVVATPNALDIFKFGEILPYSTQNYRTAYESTGVLVMNKGKWAALPADIQKIMDQANEEYSEKLARLWDEQDQIGIRNYAKLKRTVIPLSAAEEERWYQKIVPLYDVFIKEKSPKGLPAADAVKFCKDWVQTNQK